MGEGQRHAPPAHWWRLRVSASAAVREGLSNLLLDLGAQGLWEEDQAANVSLTAFFPSIANPSFLHRTVSNYLRSLAELGFDIGSSWLEVHPWKEEGKRPEANPFPPLPVGRRLTIVTPGEIYKGQPGEVIVEIEPGQAFGTGRHPTTTLALRFLERWVRGGEKVLDLGTGSGILAIAAAKLGAGRVVAVEIDPRAAEIARENSKRNRVKVEVVEGNLTQVPPGWFQLLVANLTSAEIAPLLPDLGSRLSPPEGMAFVSGLLRSEVGWFRELAQGYQLGIREMEWEGEWAGMGMAAVGGKSASLLRP